MNEWEYEDVTFTVGSETLTVPIFNTAYYVVARPSTGVPDTPPQEFYDWGGYISEGGSIYMNGKIIKFPLSTDDFTEIDDGEYACPIKMVGHPVDSVTSYNDTNLQRTINTNCQCTFSLWRLDFGGLIIEPDPIESTFTGDRYRGTYTPIAIDDGKFDDDGYQIVV
jgi:hypothetical protein